MVWTKMKDGEIRRGEIFLANLEPILGSEQGGVRPVVIIQNDIGNQYSTTTIIAPITSSVMKKEYPTNVFIKKEDSAIKRDSTILLNQIKAIDKRRILKKLGILDSFTMNKVDRALKISLGLD
jgi:mRNA interferase MazF